MNLIDSHNAERTSQRRVAAQASIRATRNLGRVWNVVAVFAGAGIAALLSGFSLWPPLFSVATVVGSISVAVGFAWVAAVLLSRPSAAMLGFGAPILVGVACAIITAHWAAVAVLFACILIPVSSLAFYHAGAR